MHTKTLYTKLWIMCTCTCEFVCFARVFFVSLFVCFLVCWCVCLIYDLHLTDNQIRTHGSQYYSELGRDVAKSVLYRTICHIFIQLNPFHRLICHILSCFNLCSTGDRNLIHWVCFWSVCTSSYSGSFCCCGWDVDAGLSCDWRLLMQWYSRTPARAPTTNAIVPVTTTAIPIVTPAVLMRIVGVMSVLGVVCVIIPEKNSFSDSLKDHLEQWLYGYFWKCMKFSV